MTRRIRIAAVAVLAATALAVGGAASGAAGYTGPVAGVAWSPNTLSRAAVGVPYSVSISAAPAGATQLEVACSTSTLTGVPPPPVAFDDCAKLPPGLTATTGTSLTIGGTPTTEGSFRFRLIAVWVDASGSDFYALQSYTLDVSTTSASPPCHCSKVGVTLMKATFAGAKASFTARLSLDCTSGSGRTCSGTATLRPPVAAGGVAWTGLLRPGDDKPLPAAKGKATVALSCFAPCGYGATVDVLVTAVGPAVAKRAGARWTIPVVPTCTGTSTRTKTLVLQFDRAGRLDPKRSKLSA